MQEDEEDNSEAHASDLDEDAEAKAERLGNRVAAGSDTRLASASGRPKDAASLGKKRATPSPVEETNGLAKQKGNKKRRKGLHLSETPNGLTPEGEPPQQSDSTAGFAEDGPGEGYEPYRRDILADVARKQREHLLGAKIGATADFRQPASCWQSSTYPHLTFSISAVRNDIDWRAQAVNTHELNRASAGGRASCSGGQSTESSRESAEGVLICQSRCPGQQQLCRRCSLHQGRHFPGDSRRLCLQGRPAGHRILSGYVSPDPA